MRRPLPDDLVVVSPHLDDAVLSLGASIAAATRAGHRITVLTVFAGDPTSVKAAGGWDGRAGYATEGEAAQARRLEDGAACAVVGAEPTWLDFSEADYRETLDQELVWERLLETLSRASAALFPGFPLTNPDHAWVTRLLGQYATHGLGQVGVYAEQPYRHWARRERSLPCSSTLEVRGAPAAASWSHPAGAWRRIGTKRRAILEYRSQVALLGLQRRRPSKLDRLLVDEALRGGEAIAWVAGG